MKNTVLSSAYVVQIWTSDLFSSSKPRQLPVKIRKFILTYDNSGSIYLNPFMIKLKRMILYSQLSFSAMRTPPVNYYFSLSSSTPMCLHLRNGRSCQEAQVLSSDLEQEKVHYFPSRLPVITAVLGSSALAENRGKLTAEW